MCEPGHRLTQTFSGGIMVPDPMGRGSFIVRIWQEPGSSSGWRGQVMEVTTHTVDYFEDFDSLVALLRRHLQRYGLESQMPDGLRQGPS